MKKKARAIGIITSHNADNYGAVLQCYALQETLRRLCPQDEVCVIDYRSPAIERMFKTLKMRKTAIATFMQFLYLPANAHTKKAFEGFRKRFLSIKEPAEFSEYDLIVYGSDQIWNTVLLNADETFFGAGYDGKKVAYAASSGGELEITERIHELLRAFSAISCREESLTEQLRRDLNSSAPITVCDPVFLFAKDDWLKIAKPPQEQGYVLVYFSNPLLIEETQALAKRFNKKVIEVVSRRGVRSLFCRQREFVASISPEEFLGYIACADFVCTTSFHGTAFSILLEKDFYAFELKRRACRITNLLARLGLSERYIAHVPDRETLEAHAIDWKPVRPRLEAYRAESMQFIEENITNTAANIFGGGVLT